MAERLAGSERYARGPVTLAAQRVTLAGMVGSRNKMRNLITSSVNSIITEVGKAHDAIESAAAYNGSNKEKLRDAKATAQREIHRKITGTTSKGRYDALKEIQASMAGIRASASLFDSPVGMLARFGVGSPERARYRDDLANAGPIELEGYLALAISTNDRHLGAALLQRIDGLKKSDRGALTVSRQELAGAVMGVEHKEAQDIIKQADNLDREAMSENRNLETGYTNPVDTIHLALNRTDAEKAERASRMGGE